MTRQAATAIALAAITAAGCGGSGAPDRAASPEPTAAAAEATVAAAERVPVERPRAVVEDCSTRSFADFPGAFANPDNVVEGPLAMIGAAYTPPDVVREFGGNKFPLLVVAGHRVTLELTRRTHKVAALAYGPLPQGEIRHRDAHRAVTFIACRRGDPTFWSGFVLAREPACVPLYAWIDDEPAPRRIVLRMGVRRCE
jgi:hypothetical protein